MSCPICGERFSKCPHTDEEVSNMMSATELAYSILKNNNCVDWEQKYTALADAVRIYFREDKEERREELMNDGKKCAYLTDIQKDDNEECPFCDSAKLLREVIGL